MSIKYYEKDGQTICIVDGALPKGAKEVPPPKSVEESDSNLAKQELAESDTQMARVGEDLIHLLADSGAIDITGLPQSSQDVLAKRASARSRI